MSIATIKGKERRLLRLPHSEVCIHMQVAGTDMLGELVGRHPMVQLYRPDGSLFSAPITAGEAGWGRVGSDHTVTWWDENNRWYPKTAEEAA